MLYRASDRADVLRAAGVSEYQIRRLAALRDAIRNGERDEMRESKWFGFWRYLIRTGRFKK